MNKLKSLLGRLETGKRLRPEQDWFVLLCAAGALLMISLFWNLWLFDDVKNGVVLGSASAPLAGFTASQRSLQAVQQAFTARANEDAKYVSGEYSFSDPSQ